MRVLLIHQAFVLGHEAGGTRHFELGRYLVRRGHQFVVVTGTTSYLSGDRTLVRQPGSQRIVEDGVEVILAYTPAGYHKSFLHRILSFLLFMASSFVAAMRAARPDVVLGTTPPLLQVVPAYLVARLRGARFVLELRDLWVDYAAEAGLVKNHLVLAVARWIERFACKQAEIVIPNSPGYVEALAARGVSQERIHVVPNGADVHAFNPYDDGRQFRKRLGLEGKCIVTYAGSFGMLNALEVVLQTAQLLRDEKDLQFLLVGSGKERVTLERKAKVMALDNVRFLDPLPKRDIPTLLAATDVGLATLIDLPSFRAVYPNKVFDYMAAGCPVVLNIDGAIRQVVEESGGGLYVPASNPQGLANAIHSLVHSPERRQEMGRLARSYVEIHFDREQLSREFECALVLALTQGAQYSS